MMMIRTRVQQARSMLPTCALPKLNMANLTATPLSPHMSCIKRKANSPLLLGMITTAGWPGYLNRSQRFLPMPASAAAREADLTDISTLLTSVPDEVPVTPLLVGSIAFGAILAVILVVKIVLYSQMELVVAAMLTRHVPGPRVIQLGGGTREIFYYPKGTQAICIVGEDINRGLMEQGGIQAGFPVKAYAQAITNLSFAPSGSVDAVVALGSLGTLKDEQQRQLLLTEVIRVLKPGCPFVFVEQLNGSGGLDGLLRKAVGVSTSRTKGVTKATVDALRNVKGFGYVQYDVALEETDPHAVGVAFKGSAVEAAAANAVMSAGKKVKGVKSNSQGFR